MELKSALKTWCDNKLKPDTDTINIINASNNDRLGKLVYIDRTSCSASYAYHDIYLLDDDTYIVYFKGGQAECLGGVYTPISIPAKKFNDLAGVLDYVMEFNGHDLNTTGSMLNFIISNYQLKLDHDATFNLNGHRVPILSKCGSDKSLINAIYELSK